MLDGLWIVQYAGMEGKGGGVVVLTNGRVLGGDSAFTYIGTYRSVENRMQADVTVQNFDPSVGNVLGISGDFQLKLNTTIIGDGIMQGDGSTPSAPGFGLKVKLTRRARLS